jgi:hypothetical protein
MKNKSFSNECEAQQPKASIQLDVERKLLPRLKFIGYITYMWCAAAFALAILAPKNTAIDTDYSNQNFAVSGLDLEDAEELEEFNAFEVLNFYAVSAIFAVVGTACFMIAWRKQKVLFEKTQANGEYTPDDSKVGR